MRSTLAVSLASFFLAAGPAPLADDGSPLLRGADPAQFELVGIGAGSIAIVDGEVRLTGKPLGYFATRQDYGDFILAFDWRYDRPADLATDAGFRGNSGVLVRIARPHKVWPGCVQVQLAQADAGAVFAIDDPTFRGRGDPAAQRAAVKAVGEWNRSEVTCRGGTVVSVLNGVEVARGDSARTARGPIGWQSEGRPIRFRAIRVRSLD